MFVCVDSVEEMQAQLKQKRKLNYHHDSNSTLKKKRNSNFDINNSNNNNNDDDDSDDVKDDLNLLNFVSYYRNGQREILTEIISDLISILDNNNNIEEEEDM